MTLTIALVVTLFGCAASAFTMQQITVTHNSLRQLLCGSDLCSSSLLDINTPKSAIASAALRRVPSLVQEVLSSKDHAGYPVEFVEAVRSLFPSAFATPEEFWVQVEQLSITRRKRMSLRASFPFFGFVPPFIGAVIPGGPPLHYTTKCFSSVVVSASPIPTNRSDNEFVFLNFTLSGQAYPGCQDVLMLASGPTINGQGFSKPEQNFVVRWNMMVLHDGTWRPMGSASSALAMTLRT
jgi:hypothetical protein